MNKTIVIVFLATFAIIGISEAKIERQSRFFRLPWIPLPPINRPPTNPNPVTPTPATSCTVVEGCTACNTANDGKCDGAGGTKGACYMEFCAIDTSGNAVYCERGCTA